MTPLTRQALGDNADQGLKHVVCRGHDLSVGVETLLCLDHRTELRREVDVGALELTRCDGAQLARSGLTVLGLARVDALLVHVVARSL